MTDRPGRPAFALVLSILGVVLAGALIIATHVAVNLEHRTAAAAVSRQRAFAISEFAIWSSIADWDGTASALPPGSASARTIRASGDSAVLTTVRLGQNMYWLVADASVGGARRRTGLNVHAVTDSAGERIWQVRRSWVEIH